MTASNTIIQIKRSSSTVVPIDGSLNPAELAYSYNSEKLFIGNAAGDGVIAIGGQFFIDQQNSIYDLVNAAYAQANTSSDTSFIFDLLNVTFNTTNSAYTLANANFDVTNAAYGLANSNYDVTNAAYTLANANFDVTNAAYTLANANFDVANAAYGYANASNTWANTTFVKLSLPGQTQTIASDIAITGNLNVTGTTTYVNTTTAQVGTNLLILDAELPNTDAPYMLQSGFQVNRGSSTNTYLVWDESFTKWAFSNDGLNELFIASNTDIEAGNSYASAVGVAANVYAAAVGVSANVYADGVGSAANTNAANASYINTGTLAVPYGGTGVGTFTVNGILYGNTTGPLNVTAAGTSGQVLQADTLGVPFFGMLDGGSF